MSYTAITISPWEAEFGQTEAGSHLAHGVNVSETSIGLGQLRMRLFEVAVLQSGFVLHEVNEMPRSHLDLAGEVLFERRFAKPSWRDGDEAWAEYHAKAGRAVFEALAAVRDRKPLAFGLLDFCPGGESTWGGVVYIPWRSSADPKDYEQRRKALKDALLAMARDKTVEYDGHNLAYQRTLLRGEA